MNWNEPGFKVNYIIVGTQKGGTTALNLFLSKHADICTAIGKEVHFFDLDAFFSEGEPKYKLYHSFFRHYAGQKVIGEATPTYMYPPHIAERLKNYNPELKLIFILRNPAERAYSHYKMRLTQNVEPLSFSEALRQEKSRLERARGDYRAGSPIWYYSYTSRGFYMTQIKNMLNHFLREQMLFLRTEELLHKHQETLTRVYNFLGVDTGCIPEPEKIFAGEYDPVPSLNRNYLLDIYSGEIDELEKFLGWDLSDWRK